MLHNNAKCQRCGGKNPVGAQVLDWDSENIAVISIANPLSHRNVTDYSRYGRSQGTQVWKQTFRTSQLLLKASREHFLVYLQIV